MKNRSTLSDGRGVLWSGGEKRVLWSYHAFDFEGGEKVEQIYPPQRAEKRGAFTTRQWAIYLCSDN